MSFCNSSPLVLRKRVSNDFRYSQVEYDREGFADSNKYLPLDFDMCTVKVLNSKKEIRYKKAWHGGCSWDGLRLKESDKVIAWKKCEE